MGAGQRREIPKEWKEERILGGEYCREIWNGSSGGRVRYISSFIVSLARRERDTVNPADNLSV